jgi:hypothetical protein
MAHADGCHVGLVVHLPEAGVADELLLIAQHDIGGHLVLGQLATVGVPRPGSQENLLLDLLDRGDVIERHLLDDRALS